MSSLESIEERLVRIEDTLSMLKLPSVEREFYSTGEAAKRLGLSPWYVRRLCSLGNILAEKHPNSGRFMISAQKWKGLNLVAMCSTRSKHLMERKKDEKQYETNI